MIYHQPGLAAPSEGISQSSQLCSGLIYAERTANPHNSKVYWETILLNSGSGNVTPITGYLARLYWNRQNSGSSSRKI